MRADCYNTLVKTKHKLFLVGMMGAGKTTVGRQLAKRLGKTFYDADREIEARTGVRVAVIFDIESEVGFRKREAELIEQLTAMSDIVLATGGGAVLDPRNREHLRTRGFVIYLHALPQRLWKRMKVDDEAARSEMLAVAGVEHRAAPGSEDDVAHCGQLLDQLGLALSKTDLALYVEDNGNAHAGSRLNLAIGIVERLAEALGELAADGGLSGAHHAHQEKIVLGLHEGIVATRPYRARKQRAGTAGPLPIRSFRSVSAGL